jgi:glycosyltransferase involved in cell wall biosynthesis
MMKKVSIITPIYKGKKYIPRLSQMISVCALTAKISADVEWIISNDDPHNPIDDNIKIANVDTVVLQTDINRGIQGARVKGLEKSTGDYVLFLDQDDVIYPEWILSQVSTIGDADACVCDALDFGIPMYNNGSRPSLLECISEEYNINRYIGFNMGQTLIKKNSIPEQWISKWLKTNCCDDYYLWLCMFAQNCKFVANPKVLFEHCKTSENQSDNVREWGASTHEMLHVIADAHIFDKKIEEKLILARERNIEEVLGEIQYKEMTALFYKGIYELMNMDYKEIPDILLSEGIAIYGYKLGEDLYKVLKQKNIDIEAIIDKNSDISSNGIPLYTMEKTPKSVKVIISTIKNQESQKSINAYYKEHRPEITTVSIWEVLKNATYTQ